MPTCLFPWSCPIFNCINGLFQYFIGPFASNVHMIASINSYLFLKIGSYPKDGGTFSLFWLCCYSNPFHLLQSTFNIMIYIPLAPTSNMLGVCDVALQEVCIWIFNILPNSQETMKGQGMCELHVFSY
jgi:hypothetical protein